MGMFDSFLLPASDPTNPNANISTPADIARKRALADALVKGGADYSPIASKWQGAARLAQGLIGGYQEGQIDRESAAGQKTAREDMAALLQGLGPSTGSPSATPMGSPMPEADAPTPQRAPPLAPAASPPALSEGAPEGFVNPSRVNGQPQNLTGPIIQPGANPPSNGSIAPAPPPPAPMPPIAPQGGPEPGSTAPIVPKPVTTVPATRPQVDPAKLMAVLSNPYSTPAAQQIAQSLLTAQLKPETPLDIERKLKLAGVTDPAEIKKYVLDSIEKSAGNAPKVIGAGGELVANDGKVLHRNEIKTAFGDAPTDVESASPLQQTIAKGIANYEINPNTLSTKGGERERAVALAKTINPDYDVREFNSTNKAITAFTTGPKGDMMRSFDVGISHLNTLSDLGKALDNGDVKLINRVKNAWKDQFGSAAPVNFDAAKEIVGDEISKAIVGSRGALADREAIKAAFSNARTPEQLDGVIKTYKSLMAGQLHGLRTQYESSVGAYSKKAGARFEDRLSEETRRELLGGAPPAAAAPAAGTNKTSNGVTWSVQ